MTAAHFVDRARVPGEALTEASPDLMSRLVQDMINDMERPGLDATSVGTGKCTIESESVSGTAAGQISASRSASMKPSERGRAMSSS